MRELLSATCRESDWNELSIKATASTMVQNERLIKSLRVTQFLSAMLSA